MFSKCIRGGKENKPYEKYINKYYEIIEKILKSSAQKIILTKLINQNLKDYLIILVEILLLKKYLIVLNFLLFLSLEIRHILPLWN